MCVLARQLNSHRLYLIPLAKPTLTIVSSLVPNTHRVFYYIAPCRAALADDVLYDTKLELELLMMTVMFCDGI